ncbi:MAG: hypothetical protein SOI38_05305 [Eggerthellaceae bacterium]|jgi:heme/copper-type cytochrome/quinol oxidase subunit 2
MGQHAQTGARGGGCLTWIIGFFIFVFAITLVVQSFVYIVLAVVLWFVIRFGWRKLCANKPDSAFVKRCQTFSSTTRKVLGALLSVLIIFAIACPSMAASGDRQKQEKLDEEQMELDEATLSPASSLVIPSNGDQEPYYLEYGADSIDPTTLVRASSSNVTVSTNDGIDPSTVGEQRVEYILTYDSHEKTEPIDFVVRDTQEPKASIDKPVIELTAGDEFSPSTNYSVSDPVDGTLETVAQQPEPTGQFDGKNLYQSGWCLLNITSPEGERTDAIDTSEPGTYTVEITGSDKNGNTIPSGTSFQVVVSAPAAQSAAEDA